jgi:leader peptidase (prepilin peptidase)/N-methyltransferase
VPIAVALLGLLLGALVPGVVYRLSTPSGEPARSACAACGVPLSGWLPGRCGGCGVRLGPPVWLTAPIGAVIFGTLAWALGPVPELAAFLVVAAVGLPLGAIDVACHRLPDPLVGGAFALAVPLLALAALVEGRPGPLVRAGLAALVMFTGYLVLALLPRADLGFGDVKLAGLLGLLLGWLGWPAVLLGALLPHLLNGPVALGLLLSGRARRNTALPLGPALLGGAWLAAVAVAGWPVWAGR